MAAGVDSPAGEGAPPLLGWPFSSLPAGAKVALAAAAVLIMTVAGYAGARFYPHAAQSNAELQARIIDVQRDPTVASWDTHLINDFLVERFYILDMATGDHYVADFMKGRITGIQTVEREDLPVQRLLLLDTKDMRRNRAFLSAYIGTVSHPGEMADGFYLGLVVPNGNSDAFPVNYNGEIPNAREPFKVGDSEDVYDFMLGQSYKDLTAARPISIFGYNYVLSSSDIFPLFKNEYRLDKAMFVSELLVVDATSRPNRATYYQLLDKYPRSNTP